jgi:peroxiredoxin
LPELEQFNAQLVGISIDNIWPHPTFAKHLNLRFPLLSDFNPKGEVSKQYGVYRQQDEQTDRAVFVIDKEGTSSSTMNGHLHHLSPLARKGLSQNLQYQEKHHHHVILYVLNPT